MCVCVCVFEGGGGGAILDDSNFILYICWAEKPPAHLTNTYKNKIKIWPLIHMPYMFSIYSGDTNTRHLNTELVYNPNNKKCAMQVQLYNCCFSKDMTQYLYHFEF